GSECSLGWVNPGPTARGSPANPRPVACCDRATLPASQRLPPDWGSESPGDVEQVRHLQHARPMMMKTICVLALGALVVGCHLDKLLGGSGGGSPPPSHGTPVGLAFTEQPRTVQAGQPIGPGPVSVGDAVGHPAAGLDTPLAF